MRTLLVKPYLCLWGAFPRPPPLWPWEPYTPVHFWMMALHTAGARTFMGNWGTEPQKAHRFPLKCPAAFGSSASTPAVV